MLIPVAANSKQRARARAPRIQWRFVQRATTRNQSALDKGRQPVDNNEHAPVAPTSDDGRLRPANYNQPRQRAPKKTMAD